MKLNSILFLSLCGLLLAGPVQSADSPAGSPTADPSAFTLDADDVSSTALFMFVKAGEPVSVRLQVGFSDAKQAELARIVGENTGKKIRIMVNGKTVSEMEFKAPNAGRSINIDCTLPEEGFAIAKMLVPKSAVTSPSPAPAGSPGSADPVIFSLSSNDVGKVVVLMSKSDPVKLEVTFSKEKQAELARIAEESASGSRRVRIVLNGKVVSEREPFASPAADRPFHTGHSIKVTYATADEAFETGRTLIKHNP